MNFDSSGLLLCKCMLVKPSLMYLSMFFMCSSKLFEMNQPVAGRSDVMEVTGPEGKAGWAGVYNGSQVSLAASNATLEILADGEVHKRLNAECEQLEHRFADLALEIGVPAQLVGLGGQFQVYFTDKKVDDYRSAYKSNPALFRIFQEEMLREGIYTLPIPLFHHGLVSAHNREDIEKATSAMCAGFEKVRKG